MSRVLKNPMGVPIIITGPIETRGNADSNVVTTKEFERKLKDLALIPCPDMSKSNLESENHPVSKGHERG
jgi:hypothetical protein